MNKVILIGRLGADPDARTTANGMTVASLRLATSERKKDGGEWVEHTEWHRVIAFGKTAETAAAHLAKGREVAIEGKIQTNKWQDKDGNDRYTTEILCDRLHFVGSKGEAKPKDAPPVARPTEGAPFDDDLPF